MTKPSNRDPQTQQKLMKWSTQKIYVAQGTDGAHVLPNNEQGVSFFSFDEGGKVAGFTATP